MRATMNIKQAQPQLFQIAPLICSVKASQAAVPLGKHDISNDETEDEVDFYILPVPKHMSIEGRTTTFHEDSLVAAFWWVGLTDVKKDANMEMTTVTKKNVDIPCLINKVDLKMGDKLIQYRAKATAAAEPPASGVVVFAGAQPEAQAKKKARSIKK